MGHLDKGIVRRSYSTAKVSGAGYVGGAIGCLYGSSPSPLTQDSYSIFTENPTGTIYIGGLIGRIASGSVDNGGLCSSVGSVVNCPEEDAMTIQNRSWSTDIWESVGDTATPTLKMLSNF